MATKISSSSSSSSRTCLCSPTSHPGSFRCSRHRRSPAAKSRHANSQSKAPIVLTNDISTSIKTSTSLIKDFLTQIIKPSGHDLQRRRNFRPKPTRFSLMNSSNADDGLAVS